MADPASLARSISEAVSRVIMLRQVSSLKFSSGGSRGGGRGPGGPPLLPYFG